MPEFDTMSTDELKDLHAKWLEKHGPGDGAVVELADLIAEREKEEDKQASYDEGSTEPVNEAGENGEGEDNNGTS